MSSNPSDRKQVQIAEPYPAQTKKSRARNSTIDFVRGVAILMVMFQHNWIIGKDASGSFPMKYVRLALAAVRVGTWTGVDLFFVLSGFLVSGLLFNEYKKNNKIDAIRFLIRRGFKIYPGFVFFIAFAFVVEKVLNFRPYTDEFSAMDYVKDLFFLHNYLGGRFVITWSLDIEELFYFLLTLYFVICIHLNTIKLKPIAYTYVSLVIIGVAGRLIVNISHPQYDFDMHYTYSHYRLDALFAGALLAYLYSFKKEQLISFLNKNRTIIIVLSIAILLPNFIFSRARNNWVSVVLLATNPIGFGALLMIILQSDHWFFKNRLMSAIGRNSYAIYLWHTFINLYLINWLSPNSSSYRFLIYIIVYFVGSIITGMIVTRLIEVPLLKVRERFFPPHKIMS